MCKLVSFLNLENDIKSSYYFSNYTKMFRHLLYINSFGNSDGTGVMKMDSKGKTSMYKRGVPSPDFLQLKVGKSITDIDIDTKFIVGHTRYGTVGGISDENSHPFHHGDIILVQNGTSQYGYKRLLKGNTSIEVDSEAVCYSIDRNGIKKTFQEYEGAGVFMWLNLKDKTFNLIKNEERTLFYGKVKGKEVYFITTDDYALEYTANRSNVDIDIIDEVDNDILFTYHLNGELDKTAMEVKQEYYYHNYNKNNFGATRKTTGNKTEAATYSNKLSCDVCECDIKTGETYYTLEDSSVICEECSTWALDVYGIQNPKEVLA